MDSDLFFDSGEKYIYIGTHPTPWCSKSQQIYTDYYSIMLHSIILNINITYPSFYSPGVIITRFPRKIVYNKKDKTLVGKKKVLFFTIDTVEKDLSY